MEEYPRKVILDSPKLGSLLIEKGQLIEVGRAKSEEVEAMEKEMDEIDKEIQALEKNVDISDLDERAKVITDSFNAVVQQMEGIKKEIKERMTAAIPKELIKKYEDKNKKKSELEHERNKIALKVQKFNDKIIPMGQKLMQPFLQDEFEDYDSLRLENGQIVATIFSHLTDFKNRFLKKKAPLPTA